MLPTPAANSRNLQHELFAASLDVLAKSGDGRRMLPRGQRALQARHCGRQGTHAQGYVRLCKARLSAYPQQDVQQTCFRTLDSLHLRLDARALQQCFDNLVMRLHLLPRLAVRKELLLYRVAVVTDGVFNCSHTNKNVISLQDGLPRNAQ